MEIKPSPGQQAWLDGVKAYENGVVRDANPFQVGTIERSQWVMGWELASTILAKREIA